MKPVYFLLAVMCFLLVAGCTPRVTQPTGWCVKYDLAWKVEKNIPAMTICVCTEEIFSGLNAALAALTSFPDSILQVDQVKPEDCGPTAKPVATNDGDAEVKDLLTR